MPVGSGSTLHLNRRQRQDRNITEGERAMRNLILAGAAMHLLHRRRTRSRRRMRTEFLHLEGRDAKVTSGGEVSYPLGEHPSGYVTMTPERMWLLFVDSARKAPASPTLTDAEAVAMMKSQVAWTGKYTVGDADLQRHQDHGARGCGVQPSDRGNDRVYFARLDGDRMTFKSPGVIVPMTGKTGVVEFAMTRSR